MAYFYGSLALLEGRMQVHVDHPGVPVQMIGAALLYLTGDGTLEIDHFRVLGYSLAGILSIGTAFLLLRTMLRDLPSLAQIAGLWTYFLCPQALEYNNIWSPELFYFPAASLVLLTAWRGDWNRLSPGRVFRIGLAVGLCCAIKYTFLGFAFALMLSLFLTPRSTWSERLHVTIIGFFGIVLAFFAATVVVAPLYPRMFGKFWHFASHKGPIGTGNIGLTDFSAILANLLTAIMAGKGWYLWLMGSFILFGVGLWRECHDKNRLPYRLVFFAIFSVAAFLSTYALATLKANMRLRYLFPTGIIGFLVFAVAMKLLPSRWLKIIKIPLVALGVLLIVTYISVDVDAHRRRLLHGYEIHQKIADTIKGLNSNKSQTTIIYSSGSPQPSCALRDLANEKQLRVIETRFPYEGHYDPWHHKIVLPSLASSWDYLVIRKDYISGFPEPLGPLLASVGEYRIFGATKSEVDGVVR
jgi:hypothetical protein